MFFMGEDPLSQSTGLSGKRKNKSYYYHLNKAEYSHQTFFFGVSR
jgi:hypothetical protein